MEEGDGYGGRGVYCDLIMFMTMRYICDGGVPCAFEAAEMNEHEHDWIRISPCFSGYGARVQASGCTHLYLY